eukprot:6655983-Lingulodinium_polyedra.AAC.1
MGSADEYRKEVSAHFLSCSVPRSTSRRRSLRPPLEEMGVSVRGAVFVLGERASSMWSVLISYLDEYVWIHR